ncbi:hypothetical protein B566_EDAN008890 [Ephemera danica]|nr:hypothetical protein B566_EDAN008890 [Ephemera danica]
MWAYISRAFIPPLVIALVAWQGPQYSLVALLALIATFIATGGRYRWLYILYMTIPRDIKILVRFVKLQLRIKSMERNNKTAYRAFTENAKKHPAKAAFYFEDQTWSYKKIDDLSGRVASAFHQLGYKRGDVVALVCHNRPEYVAIWMGLSRIGVIAALVNSNLKRKPLLHSITEALNGQCRAIIIEGGELADALSEIQNELPKEAMLFQLDKGSGFLQKAEDLNTILDGASPAGAGEKIEELGKPTDKLIYIYTSGTTGLPKAAVITHVRFMFMSLGVKYMLDIEPWDVIYNSLPLYHTAGGMIGVGHVLISGATMALRRKFSVTNFWKDCIKYRCTVAQYIGEICRYLLSAPEKPEDLNLDSKVGAVGFVPRYAGPVYPVGLIRVDEDSGEPIRDSQGLCISCEPGDILVSDEFGYFYFKDRTGDTFRWKGENVSTSEIPGAEGRAGMASVVGTFKLKKNDLQKEGYNPAVVPDPLFIMDSNTGEYKSLDAKLFQEIIDKKVRF